MAKRNWASVWLRSVQRAVGAAARSGLKAGARTAAQAARRAAKAATASAPAGRSRALPAASAAKPSVAAAGDDWISGIALAPAGARRYHLFRPPGAAAAATAGERLPLLVMLHGCTQDAAGFAHSTRMNRLAARNGFFVLYPEQDRHAHPHGCWNWYATRTGQAYGEAAIVAAAVEQACRLYPVDGERVALAGLSAGASLAALMAVRQPGRYRALVMHSGLAPGSAHSTASAIAAMQGSRPPSGAALVAALRSSAGNAVAGSALALDAATTAPPLLAAPLPALGSPLQAAGALVGTRREDAGGLPPLLVIHGTADHTVVPSNGRAAAEAWAEVLGAQAGPTRLLRRGQRHAARVTDFRRAGRTQVSLCEIENLGHAWSGGDARQPFGDAAGPDASRLAWAFVARHFAAG